MLNHNPKINSNDNLESSQKTRQAGFSLIELIVVIAIMAVLSSILVPSMVASTNESRMQTDDAVMRQLAKTYKSAFQERETNYLFTRVLGLLDDDNQYVCFLYYVNDNGHVGKPVMECGSYGTELGGDIIEWSSKLETSAENFVNGTYEIPDMKAKESVNKTYVIKLSPGSRSNQIEVESDWKTED